MDKPPATSSTLSSAPRRSGVAGRALILIVGTVLGQGAMVLASPVLTRLYSPQDFGTLAVYSALLAALTLVASLRYELAIPLSEAEHDGIALLRVSLIAAASVAVLTAVVFVPAREALGAATGASGLARLVWLLPLGVLLGGVTKAFTYWALRERDFRLIAATRLRQGIGMAGSQVLLGVLGAGALGLLVGQALGVGAGLTALARRAKAAIRGLRSPEVVRRVPAVFSRYRDFALYSTWSDLANVLGGQMPFVVFSAVYSPAVSGQYFLAHRLANAPSALISESIGKAFMTGAVEARRAGQLADLSLVSFRSLLRLALGPLLIVMPFLPEVFALGFGPDWREAGRYAQLVVPWVVCVVVVVPLTSLFAVLERQRAELTFQLVLLAARATGLLFGSVLGGAAFAIALYSSLSAIVYIGFGLWLLRIAGASWKRIYANAIPELLWSAGLAAASATLATLLAQEGASRLLIASAVGALLVASTWRIQAALRAMRVGSVSG